MGIGIKITAGIAFALMIGIGGFLLYSYYSPEKNREDEKSKTSLEKTGGAYEDFNRYTSDRFMFAFNYPKNYFLEEQELSASPIHYAIILTKDTEENRLVREGKAPGREGPPAITIGIYENSKNVGVDEWVRHTKESNFEFSNEILNEITISEKKGVWYLWSGLMFGQTHVIAHKNYIFSFTTTFLSAEDDVRKAIIRVLAGISFF